MTIAKGMSEMSPVFRAHFGTDHTFMEPILSLVTGEYQLDVVAFDTWLHRNHQYEEEIHGSMKDFIETKFGKDAAIFIEGLLTKDK